ncbi:MAG: ATP-binding protein [Lachnospiraceae bacterium]|nr:ATP-binding protein [Lachnospiraceae bacterium]
MTMLYLLSLFASGFMMIMIIKRYDFKVSSIYVLIYLLVTICDFGYIHLLRSKTLEGALLANSITYIGGCFIPFLMLLAVISICHIKQRDWIIVLGTVLCVCSFLLVSTSGMNQLNYLTVSLDTSGKYARLVKEYGPFHNFYTLTMILFAVSTYAVIVWTYQRKKDVSYSTALGLAITCSIDILTYFIEMITKTPVKLMPFAYLLTECGLFWLVSRVKKYDVAAAVSDYYSKSKEYGFVLIDSKMHFMGSNEVAEKWQPALSEWHVNKEISEEQLPFARNVKQIIDSGKQDEFFMPYEDRIIKNSVKFFYNRKKTARIGYYVEMVDDTEKQNHLKMIEEYMERLKEEKERADDANNAKSQFLSTMSHEIRTPMNAIVGMTDILLREKLPQSEREYLNNIKNSGDALLSIINDILDFSKIESGKLEILEDVYEPMSLFHDLTVLFLNRIGSKPVELLYDIDTEMPTKLYGDRQRLRQVIINLMNNAIKFTESGFVRLKVRVEPTEEGFVCLRFEIQDSGQGIKEEDIGKLFASFQQVDTKKNRNKEGTGLGLAISKQLVELMHGNIGVQSVYGQGSTFYFSLPQKLVDDMPAAVIHESVEHSKIALCIANGYLKKQVRELAVSYGITCSDFIPGTEEKTDYVIADCVDAISEAKLSDNDCKFCVLQNPMLENINEKSITVINKPLYSLNFCQLMNREELVYQSIVEEDMNFTAPEASILVVDDNEMNLKVAKGLLAPFRMRIDTAEDGQQAVHMVDERHYDLVLMDHMMPVMDGLEATAAIRALDGEYYRKLPIIALSANATVEAREMFIQGKMDDFIAKPIRMKELVRCILKWLPKERIVSSENVSADSSKLPGTEEENINRLGEIDGLNVEEGLKNCGSEKLFLELLGDFHRMIEPKCTKLQQCLQEERIRDYTIEVHALKNTARMIGAMELSDQFYRMELLGNEGKTEEIREGFPALLELYRSYEQILSPYDQSGQNGVIPVSDEKIREVLQKLHHAVDAFDLDGADCAMKELEGFYFPEELRPAIKELGTYVRDVAMEDILRLTEELCEKLCEKGTDEGIL